MEIYRAIHRHLKLSISNLRLGNSLKVKAARGGLWLSVTGVGEKVLRLVRNMILTRLLAPEVFGLMAIVLALNGVFETFTEIGIKQAIIQNPKGRESSYLNGAWWLSFGRALGLYTIASISAPWIADFYANPELVFPLRVAFLSIVFKGAISSRAYVAVKDMQFRYWTIINFASSVIGIMTSLILAYILKNVLALAIGFAVESASRFILSFVFYPFFPGFTFSRQHSRALFKFAKGMFGLPILYFIFMRADIFVIGRLCSNYDLGLYNMTVALAWAPLQLMGSIFNEVAMPILSEIQSEKERICAIIVKTISIMAFASIPILFFVSTHGKSILSIIYGHQYAVVSIPFAIIFCSELVRIISMPFATLFLAIGKPELHRLFTGVRAVLIIILIYPAVKYYGLLGAATAVLISMSISFLLQINRISKIIDLSFARVIKIISSAIAVSLPVLLLWGFFRMFLESNTMISLFAGMLGCIISYGLALKIYLNYRTKV